MKRLIPFVLLIQILLGRFGYERDDFQNFFCARKIAGIAMDERIIYFTSEYGVYRYDWVYERWRVPYTYFDVLFEGSTLPDNRFRRKWITEVDPFAQRHGRDYLRMEDDLRWGYACDEDDFAHIVPPFGFFFNYGEMAFADELMNRYPVTSCLEERHLWVGTDGIGILRVDKHSNVAKREVVGLGSPSATAIHVTEDAIFFGGVEESPGYSPAITRWDREGEWLWFSGDSVPWVEDTRVIDFLSYGDSLFCATPSGILVLDMFNLEPLEFVSMGIDSVTTLEFMNGFIYYGTAMGLRRLSPAGLEAERIGPILSVVDLAAIPGDTMWIATDRGLFIFAGEDIEPLDISDPVTLNPLDAVAFDRFSGNMWFASQWGLLQEGEPPWDRINIGYNGRFNDITPAYLYTWFGTERGVLRYRKEDETFLWYDHNWGIIDNRVRAIALDGSYIWFGTPRGATRFRWNEPHRPDY